MLHALGVNRMRETDFGRTQEEGCDDRRQEVCYRAGGARVLLLGHERRVRGVVRREEERAVRQRLQAVDVPERAAESDRREGREDDDPEEPPFHRR